MKCYICDKTLTQDEIKLTPEYGRGGLAPCGTCQQEIDEVFAEGADNEGLSLAEFLEAHEESA
jgi:hypothetical protein